MSNEEKSKTPLIKTVGAKLFAITLACIILSVSTVSGILWLGLQRTINEILKQNANTAMSALLNKTDGMKESSLEIARGIALSEDFIQAVSDKDHNAIIDAANASLFAYRGDTDFVTITDETGAVLARTHSEKSGDSVLNQQNIKEALSGNSASYIETGTEIKISVRSSSPVKNDSGQIIGAVSTGYRLDDFAMADELKSITGADVTVFLGDERINTTIIRDGERQVGTKLAPDIAEIVLNQRQGYHAMTDILGLPYSVAYEPIIVNGEAIGIFFAGIPTAEIRNSERALALSSAAVLLAVCVITVLISRMLTQKMLIKPIKRASDATVMLARGNLSIGNLSHRANDEIGELTNGIRTMAGTLEELITDMGSLAKNHDLGDTDSRIRADKFDGAYKDVAEGVNGMVSSYIRHLSDLKFVLKEFGDGNFNAEYAKLPGKKAVMNAVVEELRSDMKEISGEIDALAVSAINGKLSARADYHEFHGDWKHLLISLNEVMDAIISPIEEASQVLTEMAKGNLSARVTGNYKGDFEIIKNSLNNTQDSISSYIKEINAILSEMSRKNLSVSIERAYIGDFSEIKDSINMIIAAFNVFLHDINASTEHIAIGARQISESSMSISEGAVTQASAIQELNASIDEIAAQTEKNSETADRANSLANETKEHVMREDSMMREMLNAMEGIKAASDNISKIIKVIEDIAFQTNLLALNAAVEAARAGEHGKGFAVVADEVRNLASRSQTAARETAELIEGSMRSVSDGVSAAHQTSEELMIIVKQIGEISDFVSAIARDCKEQSTKIHQIDEGITSVSAVTQKNTAISQETAAASQELSGQSEIFKNAVAEFDLKQ